VALTRSQIRSQVYALLHQSSSDTNFSDDQINSWIDETQSLVATIIQYPRKYDSTVPAVAGTSVYALPTDWVMTLRVFCDIGGTGAKADAFTMWVAQFVGREIRVLDYYEAVGQPFATHLGWLLERGYKPHNTQIWLPHDGDTQDRVYDVSYASAFRTAQYDVSIVPNQGKGAAKARIEAGRRRFNIMWFNAPDGADHDTTPTCQGGLDALGWYHEKKDENRNIGLGPDHDWSSHGADSFGLMAVAYEIPGEYDEDDHQEERQVKSRRGGY